MHVHLDYSGVRGDPEHVQARIPRRRFAFDDDRQSQDARGVFQRRDQVEVILCFLHRRHEDVQPAVARLDAERRPRDPRGGLLQTGRAKNLVAFRRQLAEPLAPFAAAETRAARRLAARDEALAGALRSRRKRRLLDKRVRVRDPRIVYRAHPRQRIERQPQPHRRISGDQPERFIAQEPWARFPMAPAHLQRQRIADHASQPLLEYPRDTVALLFVLQVRLERIDIGRQAPLLP